jgi:lipooligosaccharide transport system ATP-binding protein
MKRRLTIARALVSEPDLLILDEPTTGLDPQARHLLWDRLYRLKSQGVTLVITTHYMDEAEQLCDRLVVMDNGRIAAAGSPAASSSGTRPVRCSSCASGARTRRRRTGWTGLAERFEVLPDRLLLYSDDGDRPLDEVHRPGLSP